MSDDLVQRLRNWEAGAAMRPTLYDEAADRIKALEAALRRMADLAEHPDWCTADGYRVMVPIIWILEALEDDDA